MRAPDYAAQRDFPIVALVCSAGGLDALITVLSALPADLPAAVIALQHVPPDRRSMLSDILHRQTALSVVRAEDGDVLLPGRVLVVPEAAHMIVCPEEHVRLIPSDGAPRPSADLLLCTLAVAMGPRAIAVILSGGGQDGATGAMAVDMRGGLTLIEDPATARNTGMPDAARLRNRQVVTLPLTAIAKALEDLVRRPPPRGGNELSTVAS